MKNTSKINFISEKKFFNIISNYPSLIPIKLSIIFFTVSAIYIHYKGITDNDITLNYFIKLLLILPFTFLLCMSYVVVRLAIQGEKRPFRIIAEKSRDALKSPANLVITISLVVAMTMTMSAFGIFKTYLPDHMPYDRDGLLIAIDHYLFLGGDPWRITHALFGPTATLIIDRIYTLWVPLLYVMTIFFAVFVREPIRMRFFATSISAWILLGTVGAYLSASVGPCFLSDISHVEAARFTELMTNLHDMDRTISGSSSSFAFTALEWQRVLWEAYQSGERGFAMGISAMPSMHVAITTIYLLCSLSYGWIARSMAGLFLLTIFVGSIHLGWHYAVDGIFSILLTTAIWTGWGYVLSRLSTHAPASAVINAASLPAAL